MTRSLLMAVALAVIFASQQANASTAEREAIDEIAIVSVEAMEELAAILADDDASPACRGYADLLLLVAIYMRHLTTFPESRVALSEFANRVMPSVAANQYACENAL